MEKKAFYDIPQDLAVKCDFTYSEDKLLALAQVVKTIVEDKVKYTDWYQRDDIKKTELKVELIHVLAEHGHPPADRDEVYKEIFEKLETANKTQ